MFTEVLLYGSECWSLQKIQERKLVSVKMCMLCWICGRTITDYILNDVYKRVLDVMSIFKKTREGCLRWYGHVR